MKYLLRNYLLVSRKKLLISILSLSLIFLNNFLLTKFRNNIFGFVFSGVYTFFVYLLLINNINLSPLSPWGLLLVGCVPFLGVTSTRGKARLDCSNLTLRPQK